MNCEYCGTKIHDSDTVYIADGEDRDDEGSMAAHTDCLVRSLEFSGDYKGARDVMLEESRARLRSSDQ